MNIKYGTSKTKNGKNKQDISSLFGFFFYKKIQVERVFATFMFSWVVVVVVV